MWNLRSQSLKNWYLGQQLYLRVYDADPNPAKERPPPDNLLLCGKCFVLNIYICSCFCDVFIFKINNVLFIYLFITCSQEPSVPYLLPLLLPFVHLAFVHLRHLLLLLTLLLLRHHRHKLHGIQKSFNKNNNTSCLFLKRFNTLLKKYL